MGPAWEEQTPEPLAAAVSGQDQLLVQAAAAVVLTLRAPGGWQLDSADRSALGGASQPRA